MPNLKGYNGKIAFVDLSARNVEIKELDPSIAERYIGGVGLAAKIILDLLKPEDYELLKKDPFSPINPLIFATGPLTGSPAPSSSRYAVAGISPLTKAWGESTSGGSFPVAFKNSGYDAIILQGKSETPAWLLIKDGTIEIKDATSKWNLDTRKVVSEIQNELNDNQVKVTSIGIAGEKLIRYAAIINDEGRAAGRCGLGALMGSKNLKAIAVKADHKMEYADKNKMIELRKTSIKATRNNFSTHFFNHYGTLCYMDMGMVIGDVPAKYFTSSEFIAENLTGRALKEKFPTFNYACSGCTIGCGRTVEYTTREKETIRVDGPEYETTAAFGPLCGVEDLEPIILANHQCNLAGIDTISAGVSIAFLIYLVENNIATEKIKSRLENIKLDEIRWGNGDVIVKLIGKICNKKGIGELLAEGTRIMAEELD
ncbi:MAG: aldehyde ferredoxin oxidoreductase family protein, partial [Promethearchaeota archaeon]